MPIYINPHHANVVIFVILSHIKYVIIIFFSFIERKKCTFVNQ